MDRGAWWAIVHRVAKSWMRLSDFTFTGRSVWKSGIVLQAMGDINGFFPAEAGHEKNNS